ncbi:MAG: 3-dehydroquinate dehydratase [Bacteriovoracaceae bacterium]|nr:3-dehydroquinate dehydratase [Bacteriovoracaceae bacterium]
MLGLREPDIYGFETLDEIIKYTNNKIQQVDASADWYQSNIEGEIVTRIQESLNQDYAAIIINPGAYSHTSIAIFDALSIIKIPVIEVHLSNTHSREEFRLRKLTARAAQSIMEGLGRDCYYLAIYSQLLKNEEI